MRITRRQVEIAVVFVVTFGVSAILLRLKLDATPAWSTLLEENHKRLLEREYTNNEQSRVLQFLVPEAIHRVLGVEVKDAYSLQRLTFIGLALAMSYAYMRRWLPVLWSAFGVLFIAFLMPFTFLNDLQESAPLLQLLFVTGLWLIAANRRPPLFALVLVLGVLANETAAILGVAFLAHRCSNYGWKRGVVHAIAVGAPAVFALGLVRFINADRPQLGGAWHLPDNLEGMYDAALSGPAQLLHLHYLDWLILTVPFLIVIATKWRYLPAELKLTMTLLPVLFVGNLITGIISESRQMVPALPLLITAALTGMYYERATQPASDLTSTS